ncbi:putative lipid-transfer protein DIR1 [Zingiber officinale]|uniref:Bifunctional inhibitor/plant lipid transfer protein/seed storage helical domain-containing protein n=1 Tax=Zingiber officinale TaxID=94328 RepID=A0A8J5GTF6_ZINOF|nr:putative lipid-transfer protein DIR1 [Zingiber officinale]KAG6512437.1 hypothetical protein ZIOFF_030548 [Zingiber officinale]
MDSPGAVIVLLTVVLLFVTAPATTEAVCNMSQAGADACKPSVTQPNPTPPSAACCKALEAADLKCFCSYKNSPLLPKLGIDPDLAAKLPAKCNLSTPDNC